MDAYYVRTAAFSRGNYEALCQNGLPCRQAQPPVEIP